jgi:outer membrane protein assembly factor BamB
MIKKLTAFFLCALLVVSAALPAFAMERSIQPLSDAVSIDNAGRSVELLYEGENARVYYGNSGISIVSETGVKHLGTNFAVKKLAVLPDADGDGYPEFLTYQDAPDYSAQIMTLSGKDGKVLADLHITHSGYDENIGFADTNSFVQQLYMTADGNALIVYDYSIVKADGKTLETIWTHTAPDNIWKAISVGDMDGDSAEDFAYTMQRNTVAILSGADGSVIKEWHPCETRQLNIDWLKKTLDAEMNMWDLVFMNGNIYATSEDGKVYAIDPSSGNCEGTDLDVLDKEYFDNLLIGYNLVYEIGTPSYRHTGEPDSGWVVLDYVDVIVHAFTHEAREYYDLDSLYKV